MPRSTQAYLADIIDSCAAIQAALASMDLQTYLASRLVRSSIEREFIIIGEAIASLSRIDPELAKSVTHARFIIGFRNRLAHDYASIDDEAVFRIAQHDIAPLQTECEGLLARLVERGGAD